MHLPRKVAHQHLTYVTLQRNIGLCSRRGDALNVVGEQPMRIRYRKPSLKTIFGLTAAKKRLKSDLGIYKVTKVISAPMNTKRRAKRAFGWESEAAKLFRFIGRLFR